jgi:GNAT superfamily N-acetyltransferase
MLRSFHPPSIGETAPRLQGYRGAVAEIRIFEPDDAESVAELLLPLLPTTVQTAESLRWRQTGEPPRTRRKSWVAEAAGEIVGFATAQMEWWSGEAGKGRIWAGVREDMRRQGIGTALWETAASHLGDARKHTTEVDDDPAGLAFVERRGFRQYDSELIFRLDPRDCTLEPKPLNGFRVVALGEMLDRKAELFDFYRDAGGVSNPRLTLEDWSAAILDNPMLDRDLGVVVLQDDRVVSLSWLLVDLERGRAENEWTATLPELRGRGLAQLAKIASIRKARSVGISEIVTGSLPHNAPMIEVNRRLGYRELYIRKDLERRIES